MIGKTISHYKILEKLGEGGMGIVYKAEDTKLGRSVALKFLSPKALGSEEDKARFLHEAQAAAALSHSNICTIHEIDEYEEQSFIVMEYLEGLSLKSKIESGPLRLAEAVDIAIQVAEGLREAHEKGIIHRDIKPANIMITPRGNVKIMDFGLAKARGQTVLTRADTTLGTYAYMSPEQTRGNDIDHRTDVWSLGVVLYEMVTGRRPFKGDYEQAVVYSIVNEEPEQVTALRTGVPIDLERIIVKCLRKKPGQRYQGLADLATDLRQVQGGIGAPRVQAPAGPKAARTGRLIHLSWLAIAVVLIILAVRILPRYFASTKESAFDDRKMLVVLPFENLGPPEDDYFAAGMTEEITSRLAAVSGLGVISRTSAVQYDRTGKTLRQIGEDLGVGYVLEGTIRWSRQAEGGSRVRVTPQLIRVSDDTHLWAETYDRVLEDIFAVQSDIAERIIEQLGVTMLARERDAVEAKPTENLLAYEAYLRGLTHVSRAGMQEDIWRKAEMLFKQAVEMDTAFALAYAKLSDVHGEIYFWGFDRTEERLAKCRIAAERSLKLQPDLPEAHMALGGYYYMGFFDYDRALKEYAVAVKAMPNSPKIMEAIAYIWRRQGLLNEAIGYLEKAATLDPQQFWYPMQIGLTYNLLRRYAEAEHHLDHSLAMEPDQVISYLIKHRNLLMWSGDVQRTRAVLESAPLQTDPSIVFSWFMQNIYERNYREAIGRLSSLPDEVNRFLSRVVSRGQLAGYAYWLMGDPERARSSYESALVLMEGWDREHPGDSAVKSALGLIYAGLGRRDDAVRSGKEGMELTVDNMLQMIEREWELVLIYTKLGEYDNALNIIEHLLSVPSTISVPVLRIHPAMDPLRENPRFRQIIAKFSEGTS